MAFLDQKEFYCSTGLYIQYDWSFMSFFPTNLLHPNGQRLLHFWGFLAFSLPLCGLTQFIAPKVYDQYPSTIVVMGYKFIMSAVFWAFSPEPNALIQLIMTAAFCFFVCMYPFLSPVAVLLNVWHPKSV